MRKKNVTIKKRDKLLLKKAYQVVEKHNNTSISFLQRKLEISYTKASELIDRILCENIDDPKGVK